MDLLLTAPLNLQNIHGVASYTLQTISYVHWLHFRIPTNGMHGLWKGEQFTSFFLQNNLLKYYVYNRCEMNILE